ncbi:restin-like protein [Labeo rohita]|uniref:Restin-like protein n=2 Tax=Labeo rohita TaxID=84645 RepID=A0A498MBG8_LABRO|nr:restin-like protein [Labeo rohita]RXN36474.1 restin-like protein [Labeo rohita]
MAEIRISQEIVVMTGSSWSPGFVQELLPSAERTALLYQLSYLCLGQFPKLERLLRDRALETQMLFGSSEAVLLKCVGTSQNLVSSLFPILMKAVEKNKPLLAVKYLEKARAWIDDIIRAVEDMVNRYEQQNRSVASCTSDVIQEKKETEKQRTQKSEEMKSLDTAVGDLKNELDKTIKAIEEIEKNIEEKNNELQNHVRDVSSRRHGLSILAALVPFVGAIIKSIHEAATAPGAAAKTKALTSELNRLSSEKCRLQNQHWTIQVKLTDLQLKVANSKIQLGVIPSPVHLEEVQKCLSQIQQILIQLKKFWEKVGSLLDSLKEKTFVGEDLIDDLEELKEEFLISIETAGKHWQSFGACCQRASGIFSVQSRDAYKFLETDPSTLSEAEWKEQYESIMEKLKQITPLGPSVPAIAE